MRGSAARRGGAPSPRPRTVASFHLRPEPASDARRSFLQAEVAGDIEMDLAHFEAPFVAFLHQQVLITPGQRGHDTAAAVRLPQHDDIAVGARLRAIDA